MSTALRNLQHRIGLLRDERINRRLVLQETLADCCRGSIHEAKPNDLRRCAVDKCQMVKVAVCRNDAVALLAGKSSNFDVRHPQQTEMPHLRVVRKIRFQHRTQLWR